MKKFVAFLLALIMALVPIIGLAASSKTVKDLSWTKPRIQISYMDPTEDIIALSFADVLPVNYEWFLDDLYIISFKNPIENIDWTLTAPYEEKDQVIAILTKEDYKPLYVLDGVIDSETGGVAFNFKDVKPDSYIMFVYAAH